MFVATDDAIDAFNDVTEDLKTNVGLRILDNISSQSPVELNKNFEMAACLSPIRGKISQDM